MVLEWCRNGAIQWSGDDTKNQYWNDATIPDLGISLQELLRTLMVRYCTDWPSNERLCSSACDTLQGQVQQQETDELKQVENLLMKTLV